MTISTINSRNNYIKKDGSYKELDTLLDNRDEVHNRTTFVRTLMNWGKFLLHEIKNNVFVYLLSILYLCVCVMNKVFAKRTMNKIGNYSFVTSETHNTICLFVFFMVYFIFKRYNNFPENRRNKNPIIYYFIISVLDASTVIISFIGLTRTAGNIQSFALQLSIPINMFFCFLVLRYRYHLFNYLGAFIIVATIAIVEMKISMETQEENSIIFNLIFISSLIPFCFSNMSREILFRKYDTNILKLNGMVSLFQILTSCLLLPVYTLPFLKQLQLPFSEILVNVKNGFACLFFGKNTVVENCGFGMSRICDDCEGAWKTFIVYSFFNICDNLICSYILDKFSTMTYTIVSCIQGPAITMAYYFKFIAGDVMRKPRLLDFVTLFGYLLGSIIYRAGNIILERKKEREEGNNENLDDQLTDTESTII